MTQPGPVGRYPGRGRIPPRWIAIALGIVVVIAGVGIAYVGYKEFGPKELEGTPVTYTIVDDTTVSLRFTVTRKDPSRPVDCIVRARAKGGNEVGRREVYVEPSPSGTVEVTTTIRTSAPPAIGDVYGCSFDVPKYLKTG
ncbi:DUF4307 domain-containing protein [Antrihabitans cavernicola]|uniref:DUF4307 domain-containing protein n=1 Tax=Antrihabitans cavernicola TaxID=2495913 RepID=A0A5A7SDV2_9NOCA|nr:DUF4307 domain-containing protein [Spelaeibacter cavernicola]KAA0024338.1 DUF4307 domain-containing protein [Spelaeibacter cavernicola]